MKLMKKKKLLMNKKLIENYQTNLKEEYSNKFGGELLNVMNK